MLKNNYHTHTYLCNHASGTPLDYANKAIELGFEELGISDHGPMPRELEKPDEPGKPICRNMNVDEFYRLYLPLFNEAKEKVENRINLYVGLETEYAKKYHNHYKEMRDDLDYMILGVHWFFIDDVIYNTYADVDSSTIYGYLNTVNEALDSGLYTYLAHPDLFFIQYNHGECIWDKHCEIVSKGIIEACIRNNVYIEINANGPNNSRRFNHNDSWLYPNENFWRLAAEYKDLKIVIGADAHNVNMLNTDDMELIDRFIKRLGLKVLEKIDITRKKDN